MKILYRLSLLLALVLQCVPAFSAISCSVTPNPSDVNVIYSGSTAVNTTGTLNVTCTRDPNNDPNKPTIWIGMTQTSAGRNALLDTGGSSLNYEISHGGPTTGTWTDTGNVNQNSNTNGAVQDSINFKGGSTVVSTYTFYFNVPAFQFPVRPPGVYVDSVPITVRLNDQSGAIITTGSLSVHISILKSCRFSTPPAAIAVNYVAFSPQPVTGSANFGVTCTQSTPYQLSLSPTRSVVPNVDLAYGLSLTSPAGNITGTATEQTYTVNISVDAGQPGTCSTSTCSGTDTTPVLTISY
jgi:hypothetical protein